VANGSHANRVESTAPLTLGQWQHAAVSLGSELALYIDGAPAGTVATGSSPSISGDVLIGALDEAGGAGAFTGQLDEVELSKIPRSSWWARVTALGQSPQTTVMEYGKDESKGTAGKFAAYLAMMSNLLSQVSLDGLAVITITALMGLASMQVLFSKAALMRRIERQDGEFIPTFRERLPREVGATMAGLKVLGAGYDQSGLYAMYRAGLGGLEAVAAVSGGSGLKMRRARWGLGRGEQSHERTARRHDHRDCGRALPRASRYRRWGHDHICGNCRRGRCQREHHRARRRRRHDRDRGGLIGRDSIALRL
jgi:hypothetical protein